MLVKDYLKSIGKTEKSIDNLTFIVTNMEKDEKSPIFRQLYSTTPIRSVEEWYKENSKFLDYVLLNPKQPPISWASSNTLSEWYECGRLLCFLVISKEDLQKRYPKQAKNLITYNDRYMK